LRLRLAILLLLAAAPARAQDMHPIDVPSPSWLLTLGGYVHVAYRWIQQPSNYNLAGKNNGFQLEQARAGINVQYKDSLAIRVSFEGASEDRINQSFPGGTLTARLRDAYITYASPWRFLRASIGQMVTVWDLDSMRSDAWLPFASRSVAAEGVQPNEGRQLLGMGQDRNLGLALHSGDIALGRRASVRYQLFVGNGNGQNQILNSNNKPAVFGRVEFALWDKAGIPPDQIGPMRARTDGKLPYLGLGVAAQYNPRTGGNPPDLVDETDTGVAADLIAAAFGVDLEAGILYLRTKYETLSSTPDLERFGWWAHARYTIPKIPVELTVGYRISSYSPRAHLSTNPATPADAVIDSAYDLLYHTFGIGIRPTRTFPLRFEINYTITGESGPLVLDNDRVEADAVAVF
jgi:hypothetical protein